MVPTAWPSTSTCASAGQVAARNGTPPATGSSGVATPGGRDEQAGSDAGDATASQQPGGRGRPSDGNEGQHPESNHSHSTRQYEATRASSTRASCDDNSDVGAAWEGEMERVHEQTLPADEGGPWAARSRLEDHYAEAPVPWAYPRRSLGVPLEAQAHQHRTVTTDGQRFFSDRIVYLE